jgi:hypothetical protein
MFNTRADFASSQIVAAATVAVSALVFIEIDSD